VINKALEVFNKIEPSDAEIVEKSYSEEELAKQEGLSVTDEYKFLTEQEETQFRALLTYMKDIFVESKSSIENKQGSNFRVRKIKTVISEEFKEFFDDRIMFVSHRGFFSRLFKLRRVKNGQLTEKLFRL
jgi:hypothetical protein